MPGFWTVLKWTMAVVLAPIIVWSVIAIFFIGVAMCSHDNTSANPRPAATKRR